MQLGYVIQMRLAGHLGRRYWAKKEQGDLVIHSERSENKKKALEVKLRWKLEECRELAMELITDKTAREQYERFSRGGK